MSTALTETTNKIGAENVTNIADKILMESIEGAIAKPNGEKSAEKVDELTDEKKTEEMKKYLLVGRRLLITNNFTAATDILSDASKLAGELFGDDSEHSFEPFFYYAQALLELAKMEDQVFSNALSNIPIQEEQESNDPADEEKYGNPEKLTEEQRDEIKQQVEDALESGAEGQTEKGKTSESDVPAVKTTTETVEEDTTADGNEDGDVAEGDAGEQEGEEDDDDDEDEDDESPMKLAWELFEASRRICDKKLESLTEDAVEDLKKWTLLKADALGFLGEHGIVDGKAEQAQKDLMDAIELQSKHHGDTSRVLAQTYHLLAKAFRMEGGFEEAATHFEKSKQFLVGRAKELETQLQSAVDDAKKEIEEELKDLTDLIPDMDVFIDDAKASAEQAAKVKQTVKEELASAAAVLKNLTGGGDSTEAVKEANDISGMIRRPAKRQASPQTTEDEKDIAKKTKSDE